MPTPPLNNLRNASTIPGQPEQTLADMFVSFRDAASSLELSYRHLQREVEHLRKELGVSRHELVESVKDANRTRAYLDRILANMPCGVLVVDAEQRVRVFNTTAAQMLSSATGKKPHSTEILPAEHLRLLDQPGNGEEPPTWPNRDGEPRCIRVRRAANPEDSAAGTIYVLEDVTEEKRRATEAEAARRSSAITELATLLEHDLRNRLASMQMVVSVLDNSIGADQSAREWLEHLQAALCALSVTVDNVLMSQAPQTATLSPLHIADLLRELPLLVRELARLHRTEIQIAVQDNVPAVFGVAHALRQLFLNLALNSFAAAGDRGSLTISCRRAGALLCIDFVDSGTGIAAADLPKVFDAGFTTHPGRAGLGLTVAKAIMQRHGGSISIESEPGRGSTVRLLFPVPESIA